MTILSTTSTSVGDQYVGISFVWTVTGVEPIVGVDGEATVKVVLTHPLAGELHLPMGDFEHMVAVGSLTAEPAGSTK